MPRITLVELATLVAASLTVAGCSSSGGSKPTGQAPTTAASGPAGQVSSGGKKSTSTSKAPNAASGGTIDVCSLMTSAQASAINKATYGAAASQHLQTGFDRCNYTNTGKPGAPDVIQDLTVTVISVPNCYERMKSNFKLGSGSSGKPLSGVGDEAFGHYNGIVVRVGSSCLDVSGLRHSKADTDYHRDIAIAKLVIGKLPR